MELLEREPVLDQLQAHLAEAREGSGRVVVVRGEAGIGKTSVIKEFCDNHADEVHVLLGSCDDLITPQPLAPIWDMAFSDPSLETALLEDNRHGVFRAVHELMTRSLRPTVVVIEDVHWADESTIDLVRYISRRVTQTHGLMILTYREDAHTRDRPVQLAIGELSSEAIEQIRLEPLSRDAVSRLAGDRSDADELWRLTNGNPFFVGELLETEPGSVPVSISDAVRAKLMRLSSMGRDLAELVSVVPGRVRLSLVDEILDDPTPAIDECERVRILEVDQTSLAFRHELARRAVEAGLTEIRRRELNQTILDAVDARGDDVAFAAHFAREAGDTDAMLRILPVAARSAAELDSHREALSHLRALEPLLTKMDDEQLADHYHLWAREELMAGGAEAEAISLRAVALRRKQADPILLGKTLRLASDISWWVGKRDSAISLAEEAVEVLEPVGGEPLARAYSTVSRWAMVSSDWDTTLDYADKALHLLDQSPSLARLVALNNRGSIMAEVNYPEGLGDIEESYEMAATLGLPSHQIRAAYNIASTAIGLDHDIETGKMWLDRGFALAIEAQMPGFNLGILASYARVDELAGDWEQGEHAARKALANPAGGMHHAIAATVLARIMVRRGQPGARDAALDAWILARESDEPQRLSLPASVLLEASWLGLAMDPDLIQETKSAYEENLSRATSMLFSETAFWLSIVDEIDRVHENAMKPYVHLDRGEWTEAATFWSERGIPYEKALSLSFGDKEAKLEALTILDHLGAVPLAARVRGELQSAGLTVPRGPTQATLESPLGLTPRQSEVLELMADDLTNAEIADRLFVSTRTIDHHVSAILSKLGVSNRHDAVARAQEADVAR